MFKSNITKITLLLLICAVTFTACDDDDSSTGPETELNILETVETESNLSSFNDLLSQQGLSDTLAEDTPMTVFAPTDDALAEENLDDKTDEEINSLLQYHILNTKLTLEDLQNTESVETFSGDTLFFESTDGEVTINSDQATITAEGIEATNGIVFKVDTLLTPVEE